MITLGQTKSDNINQLIILTDDCHIVKNYNILIKNLDNKINFTKLNLIKL